MRHSSGSSTGHSQVCLNRSSKKHFPISSRGKPHLPFPSTTTVPISTPHLWYGVECTCFVFCCSRFQVPVPRPGQTRKRSTSTMILVILGLWDCCCPQASETCSGWTQHHKNPSCFWPVLLSCHLLLVRIPLQTTTSKTPCFQAESVRGDPQQHPHTRMSDPLQSQCKRPKPHNLRCSPALSQASEHKHFPDILITAVNSRAFQEANLKLRHNLSQFCSESFLQPSRAPVNVIPKRCSFFFFWEDTFHNLLDQKASYWR